MNKVKSEKSVNEEFTLTTVLENEPTGKKRVMMFLTEKKAPFRQTRHTPFIADDAEIERAHDFWLKMIEEGKAQDFLVRSKNGGKAKGFLTRHVKVQEEVSERG